MSPSRPSRSAERIETEVFDWKLKREKEEKEGRARSKVSAEEEERRKQDVLVPFPPRLLPCWPFHLTFSIQREVEKLKKQREERLREQMAAREERELIDRGKEMEMNDELTRKEDEVSSFGSI